MSLRTIRVAVAHEDFVTRTGSMTVLAACEGELVDAVRRVRHGAPYLSPPVAARLAESLAADPLTGREQHVLSLIVDALCNKHIASRLQISVGTVTIHVRSLFDKLNVRTRTAAAATAARRGLRRCINSTGIDPEGGAATGLAIPPPGRDGGNRVREGVPEQITLLLQA